MKKSDNLHNHNIDKTEGMSSQEYSSWLKNALDDTPIDASSFEYRRYIKEEQKANKELRDKEEKEWKEIKTKIDIGIRKWFGPIGWEIWFFITYNKAFILGCSIGIIAGYLIWAQ